MTKEIAEIEIQYKDGNWGSFSIPVDETHAQDIVDIGTQLGTYEGGPTFLALANKETDAILFVNLEEVRTVHMKTVVAE